MNTLKRSIKNYIQERSLIKAGDKIIAGVSGGADSVSLLHILDSLKHELGFTLHIAHYNHNIRKGSLSDQNFVKGLADKLNLPFLTGTWKDFNPKAKGSIEELARKKRFDFFFRSAKKVHAQKIALAHNKDDLAETVLMRVIRGTGLKGIRGILPKREIEGFTFIRPLLNTPRKDIEAFLRKNKIPYIKDPTNDETTFFRNRIRHELLPLLEKKYNKNIRDILSSLADNASSDYEYLEERANKFLSKISIPPQGSKRSIVLDLLKYVKQPEAIKRMIVRKCIENLKGDTNRLTLNNYKDIDDLIKNKPSKSSLNLPAGIKIQKTGKTLNFIYK